MYSRTAASTTSFLDLSRKCAAWEISASVSTSTLTGATPEAISLPPTQVPEYQSCGTPADEEGPSRSTTFLPNCQRQAQGHTRRRGVPAACCQHQPRSNVGIASFRLAGSRPCLAVQAGGVRP